MNRVRVVVVRWLTVKCFFITCDNVSLWSFFILGMGFDVMLEWIWRFSVGSGNWEGYECWELRDEGVESWEIRR